MTEAARGTHDSSKLQRLALAALGVVYGDIGTSPLYAFKESLIDAGTSDRQGVLGILSLILWSLILVVSIKYVIFVLRADHRGEGGILALVGILFDRKAKQPGSISPRMIMACTMIGVFGAALLYGDGIITPAISVLSAVEGLEFAAPQLHPFIVPIAVVILLVLFLAQRVGTGRVGAIFGPVMLLWFAFLSSMGIWNICKAPEILAAFNPMHGLHHLHVHGFHGFLVLGSVFLAITGAEALYADLGHFGRGPIRLGWHSIVLPALALNYLGQGAFVLHDPSAASNPFYASTPSWLLFPAIALATAATVIASQALISGAFSLTLQAMHLGYCPKMLVKHTSHSERGQVYIPQINWFLMIGCIALVIGFRSSGAMAAAYGIAVTMTMILTTTLFVVVTIKVWRWPRWASIAFAIFFGVIECAFLAANLFKVIHGGWFTIATALVIFYLMTTWKAGRDALYASIKPALLPLDLFLKQIKESPPTRIKGSAIFLSSMANVAPLALLHNLRHNQVLHETVVIISVYTELRAYLDPEEETIKVEHLGDGFHKVSARFGYMENPNIRLVVSLLPDFGVSLNAERMTYFLSRERLAPSKSKRLSPLRRTLFTFLARNANSPADIFCLPPGKVVELGIQVEC